MAISVQVTATVKLSEIETSDLIEELKGRHGSFSELSYFDTVNLASKVEAAYAIGDKKEVEKATANYFEAVHDINTRIR